MARGHNELLRLQRARLKVERVMHGLDPHSKRIARLTLKVIRRKIRKHPPEEIKRTNRQAWEEVHASSAQ